MGAVALAGCLVELGRDVAPDHTFMGVVGGVATLVVAASILRRPHGNH